MKKRFFIEILKEICLEERLELEIFSHEWLCKITDPKTKKCTWTEGYNFDLNSAVNYITLYDKVNTSTILKSSGVPCVEHFLIIKEGWRKDLQIEKTWQEELTEIVKIIGENVVIKNANGSQGLNIYRAKSMGEIQNIVELLKDKHNIAISKYFESEFEYRFYVLDGKILFSYKKIRNSKNEWKHNLSQGAKPELIDESHPKYFDLAKIAMMANDSFGLRCGAIDILDTVEGLKIIEINNGIMMDGFAAHSKEYFEIAKNAHKKMLFASLQK